MSSSQTMVGRILIYYGVKEKSIVSNINYIYSVFQIDDPTIAIFLIRRDRKLVRWEMF